MSVMSRFISYFLLLALFGGTILPHQVSAQALNASDREVIQSKLLIALSELLTLRLSLLSDRSEPATQSFVRMQDSSSRRDISDSIGDSLRDLEEQFTTDALTVTGGATGAYFTATSPTDTSTFAGSLSVEGSVGIGTTSPQSQLHVVSALATDLSLILDTTSANQDTLLSLREAGVEKWKIRNQGDNDDRLRISSPDNADAFTILKAGNIGIGATSPASKLQVGDGTANVFVNVKGTASDLYFGTSGNTRFGFAGSGVGLMMESSGTVPLAVGTFSGLPLILGTNNTERIRITSNGDIGIGTTTPITRLSNTSTNIADFGGSRNVDTTGFTWRTGTSASKYVAGFENTTNTTGAGGLVIRTANTNSGTYLLQLVAGGTETASFTADGQAYKPGGGSFTATSDRRAKKNIETLTLGLDAIRDLNPVTFQYNGEYPSAPDNGKTYVGFIAQDIAETSFAPYMLSEDSNGLYRLDPSALPFALVGAVKELDLEIDDFAEGLEVSEGETFVERIFAWIEDKVFRARRVETDEMCIGEKNNTICFDRDDARALKEMLDEHASSGVNIAVPHEDTPHAEEKVTDNPSPEDVDEEEVVVEENNVENEVEDPGPSSEIVSEEDTSEAVLLPSE